MAGTAAFFDLDRTLIRGSANVPLAGHPAEDDPELRAVAHARGWRVVEVAPARRFALVGAVRRLLAVVRRRPSEVAAAPQ